MDSLFRKWSSRIPDYSIKFKDLFDSLSTKFGKEGDSKISLGRHFSTNYELYIYAFFLGLYENECVPLEEDEKRVNFSYSIQNWGGKQNKPDRKKFTDLQKYIFAALVAKTDFDFLALEKGEVTENAVIRKLMTTFESFTNGGLIAIKETHEDNAAFFARPEAFLNMISQSNYSSREKP